MKRLAPFCLVLLLLAGCGPQESARQFFAMDTFMTITAYGQGADAAALAAQERIIALDRLLSRTREDSDIGRLNAAVGSVSVSGETAELLRLSLECAGEFDAAFTPVIAPLMDAWGFGGETYRVPTQGELAALLPLVRPDGLTVGEADAALAIPGAQADLGGIAKGYAADQGMAILRAEGVTSALLNLGNSSVAALGSRPDGKPWRIAVKDPEDQERYVGVLSLVDTTVSTTGAYERFFEQDGKRYHHIIDPSTGYPAQSGLQSVTVVSPQGAWNDAASTAFFVMGADAALDHWRSTEGFDLVLIGDDRRVQVTEGLEAAFAFEGEGSGYTYEIIRR